MAWGKPVVSLSMKTYMTVTVIETDLEKNVLKTISVTIPRNASAEIVESALKAKLDKQTMKTNEIAALETKLSDVVITKGI